MKTADFNKLPRAQKRILIAKDVIKQLNAQQLVANTGDYIDKFRIAKLLGNKPKANIKTHYSKIKSCKVCAMGACLLAATKFGNQLKLDDLNDALWKENERTDKLLVSIFSKKQMLMIETAFEGNFGSKYAYDVLDESLDGGEISRCSDFRTEFAEDYGDNENALLIAIMQNIIKNKGTFKP